MNKHYKKKQESILSDWNENIVTITNYLPQITRSKNILFNESLSERNWEPLIRPPKGHQWWPLGGLIKGSQFDDSLMPLVMMSDDSSLIMTRGIRLSDGCRIVIEGSDEPWSIKVVRSKYAYIIPDQINIWTNSFV